MGWPWFIKIALLSWPFDGVLLATMDGLFMFFRTAFPMPFPFPHLAEFIVIDAVLARFILVALSVNVMAILAGCDISSSPFSTLGRG